MLNTPSFQPKHIPEFIEKQAETDADLVSGTRSGMKKVFKIKLTHSDYSLTDMLAMVASVDGI